MSMVEMNKEAFKEFAKVVLFFCNYSKRKVYTRHLKYMLIYYFIQYHQDNQNNTKLIEYSINEDGVAIAGFDDYLAIMKKIDFVGLEKNIYGTIVVAKKKLEDSSYEKHQHAVLLETIEKSIDELQDLLSINKKYSSDREDIL